MHPNLQYILKFREDAWVINLFGGKFRHQATVVTDSAKNYGGGDGISPSLTRLRERPLDGGEGG